MNKLRELKFRNSGLKQHPKTQELQLPLQLPPSCWNSKQANFPANPNEMSQPLLT